MDKKIWGSFYYLKDQENGGNNIVLTALNQGDTFHSISGEVSNLPDESAGPHVNAITTVNLINVIADHSLISTDKFYMLNVPPGDYVLYFCADEIPTVQENVTVDQDDVVLNTTF